MVPSASWGVAFTHFISVIISVLSRNVHFLSYFNPKVLAWDLCCSNFCLFGPKEAASLTSSIRYVLPIETTLESYAHCSRYLARLSAPNKPTLLAPDSRGR
jgi:hypothetical protein